MKRILVALSELAALAALLILLVPVLRPTAADSASGRQAPPSVAVSTALAPWDSSLVLPDTSERIVHYSMDVRLDTATNIIHGTETLDWRNTTGQPQSEIPFHLYQNAFRNNRSTFAKENGWELRDDMAPGDYGGTEIRKFGIVDGDSVIDLLPTLAFLHPDDDNADDRTVARITVPEHLAGAPSLRFVIVFETKQPKPVSRTGVVREYHFVSQWFPKIGVWWKGEWNCHQFHANTEYFADYGTYDVRITLPARYRVGATGGIPRSTRDNADGTVTHAFHQDDVHDFAWVADPEAEITVRTFRHRTPEPGEQPGRHHPLRDVNVILFSQPHHANAVERYFTATFNALRWFGEWYGTYPYETITVVDPAEGSRSGGMEYPTLITGGTTMFAPREEDSPEEVTVHEFGHQFWYGLVGNNEFEEAWLDEGFNTYSTDRVMRTAWPPFRMTRSFFGGSGADTYTGIPWVVDGVERRGLEASNSELRHAGKNDVMARPGWMYRQSYGLNSYSKPALSLMMLERFLGEPTMYRVMRTYHHRYRFRHPTSADFIATVNEVTGQDLRWFFDQTWYSSDLFDYAVESIDNRTVPEAEGTFDWSSDTSAVPVGKKDPAYDCTVTVTRKGEAIARVEVSVTFSDGTVRRERWDGAYRWKKFRYASNLRIVSAVVDPEGKIVMDVNRSNNSFVVREPGSVSLAARKYAGKFLFWMQNYLEMTSYWH